MQDSSPEASSKPFPLRFLLFLTIVNVLGYLDRYIVHSVEPLLKGEFQLSNEESGWLTTAFVWGYFLFSPVFGYLGDRYNKRWLMFTGILLWSLATGATGLATTFTVFFFVRTLVGVGEASFGTIAPGYLKDHIPDPKQLNKVLGLFFTAIPLGAALGYVIGGQIAHHFNWHYVFYAAAIPGLLLAIGFLWLPEASSTTKREPPPPLGTSLRKVASVPVLWFAIGGYVLNSFALNGIAPFVVRYGHALGFELKEIQDYFGLILALTGTLGAFFGSRACARFLTKSTSPIATMLSFVGVSTLLGVPFLALAFLVSGKYLFLACCFFAQLLLFAGVAPVNAVIVERAPRGLETLTQGITILALNLLGNILSAFTVGKVADLMLAHYTAKGIAPHEAEFLSLSLALQTTTCAMFVAGVIWIVGSRLDRKRVS